MARIIDVIEAPNQGPNELVSRVPQFDSGDFRLGSQVIVRESQRAVFYRDGKSLDLFDPGRHTITTANVPILTGLLQLASSGDTIFTAEVYFTNMREFTDLKWGTPQPISLRDSELGLVRLRANGQYTMQLEDPKRFVDQIVGVQGMYQTTQIEDYLRGVIVSRMTDAVAESMTSIFDMAALYNELGAAMRATLQDDFSAMGIALKQFMVISITPTEETAKAIDERAAMGAIGNMDAYVKFKAAQAMQSASEGGGGGGGGASEGMGLGAGIGMGAGMAGMIANAMQGAQQPQQAQQPAQPAAASVPDVMTLDEAAAYLKVSAEDVQAIIDSGELSARKIGSQYRISKSAVDAFLGG